MQISFAVTAKLIIAFVFAAQIEESLFFLHPKFQASSYLLWLYSPVCVGSGRNPKLLVFSCTGSCILLSIGGIGEEPVDGGKIVAQTKTGTIQLQYQDWFSALNLIKDP